MLCSNRVKSKSLDRTDWPIDTIQALLCCEYSAMTGRRLLDVAAIFKASRGVAAKHVALRQNQFDIYSKTSSLAKAVKSQTDRVTLTVKAASVLAQRFNGPGSEHFTQASQSRRSPQDVSIPSQGGASGKAEELEKKGGLLQDHFYERSDQNSAAETPPDGDLAIKQEKAKEYPLPDGSIFPADITEAPKRDTDSDSELPQGEHVIAPSANDRDQRLQPTSSGRTSSPNPAQGVECATPEKSKQLKQQAEKQISFQARELPPAALSEESVLEANKDRGVLYTSPSPDGQSTLPDFNLAKNAEDAQKSEDHVSEAQVSQDLSYPSSSESAEQPIPQVQAVPEQDQTSDEAYTELFHSPRIARMLGGQPKPSKPSKGLEMSGAQGTPMKQTKSPQEKDQVSYSIRTPGKEIQGGTQDLPARIIDSKPSQAKDNEDVHDLAADMANDAEAMFADKPQVIFAQDLSTTSVLID